MTPHVDTDHPVGRCQCRSNTIGKPVADLTSLEYPYDNREDVLKFFFEKGYWNGEVIQKRKDGSIINILASVSLIVDEKGTSIGAVAVNRNITE